ncbi:hypothetical protein [Streptomyces werraensis]|uniref:hypothetical protein n=1 Tax=Streptomyces werraensis TaxID=68284 RepID=UPI00342A37FD
MHHYTRPEQHYVKPGDTVVVRAGWSECMLHLGLADKFIPMTVLEDGYGQILNPETGRPSGMPNPLNWISSFYRDQDRNWYGTDVWEFGVGHTVTHTAGRFYVYVDGKQTYGVQSLRFEEMRDEARAMHARGIDSAEVRFVENSRHLNPSWSRSVTVPLDTKVQEKTGRNSLGAYRDTYLDVPTHFNLFAGRYFLQEV